MIQCASFAVTAQPAKDLLQTALVEDHPTMELEIAIAQCLGTVELVARMTVVHGAILELLVALVPLILPAMELLLAMHGAAMLPLIVQHAFNRTAVDGALPHPLAWMQELPLVC